MSVIHSLRYLVVAASVVTLGWSVHGERVEAQVVPGTGIKVEKAGDDFEDESWDFTHNFPKGSKENDENTRGPLGMSKNRRWFEGPMRGQPDHLKRVTPPAGGIEGSTGALLMQTLHSGVPRLISHKPQQDDLVCNVRANTGGFFSVSRTPSVVARVFIPPPEQWENRTGVSFGFRAGTWGRFYNGPPRKNKEGKTTKPGELDEYWPGMFVKLSPGKGQQPSSAQILVRANQRGMDMSGPMIEEPGWWTLGMSFTPDGKIHYYASPGVDALTAEDYITTSNPYGFVCERFSTYFFNVVNQDDGSTWSTPWVIDDCEMFVLR